ncbi:MAG TPA: flippase [Terriglobales bacterium]|jgi:O-antigen/teichoic acid export membrane protein
MATSQVPETPRNVPDAVLGTATAVADIPAPKQQDVSKLAAGAGVALTGRIVGRGLLLGIDVALARLLGPAQYGFYVIGWTITRLATLLSPLGLNAGVIRFGARYGRQDEARFKGVLLFCIGGAALVAAVLGAGLFFAAPWLAGEVYHKPDLAGSFRWFALGFPAAATVTVAAAATRITQRMKSGVITEDLSQPAIGLSLILILVGVFKLGINGALIAYLVSFLMAAVIGAYYVAKLFPVVRKSSVKAIYPGKDLIAFSLPASLTGVLGVMIIWVNRLFVGYFRSTSEVGIYQVASQVPVTVALVVGAVSAIFSPMVADFAHRGQFDKVREIYVIGTKWTLYFSMPALLLMALAPREVITVLFGASYADGGTALKILALGQLFNAGSGCVGTLLVMTGNQKITSALYAIMFAVNVAMSVLLIPRYGVPGAAWATTLTACGLFAPALVIAWQRLRMVPWDGRYWKLLMATAISGAAMLIPLPMLKVLPHLLVEGFFATVVFWGVMFAAGFDAEDRHFMGMIRARIKSNFSRRQDSYVS